MEEDYIPAFGLQVGARFNSRGFWKPQSNLMRPRKYKHSETKGIGSSKREEHFSNVYNSLPLQYAQHLS